MSLDVFRMTPRQFRKAAEAGAFGESKVELLDGIVCRMTTNPPHLIAVHNLFDALRQLAPPPGWFVAMECSVALGRWLPVPDIAALRGPRHVYASRLPKASDVALLVEVSDTTYAKDRGPKYRKYATHRIPVYWVVDLNRRLVEVHTEPAGRGKSASYRACAVYHEPDQVPVVLDGREAGRIPVPDILP
jgi:Uma2 family endonuclease